MSRELTNLEKLNQKFETLKGIIDIKFTINPVFMGSSDELCKEALEWLEKLENGELEKSSVMNLTYGTLTQK